MQLIYTVCKDAEEARKISRHLLERRLAACTNMFPIDSEYWWEGEIIRDKEVALLIKTRQGRFEPVRQAIASLHSYTTPCIIALNVAETEAKYLKWLQSEVS
ncbi:MAG: divalent-cation tolerance protein CutA [Chloroflexi bacterium]|nr:divalent-cation tolerance protein CutA [Chloroflexota bacterium]MCL5074043.1 divalent-cation tolerance protein CutA [Chloroflexota bacterium]